MRACGVGYERRGADQWSTLRSRVHRYSARQNERQAKKDDPSPPPAPHWPVTNIFVIYNAIETFHKLFLAELRLDKSHSM